MKTDFIINQKKHKVKFILDWKTGKFGLYYTIARLKRVCALFCNCIINRISDLRTKTNEVSNFHAQYF